TVYFAMKLVQGETLASLLKDRAAGAQDLPKFLKAFEQVCQALAYAHSRGVIHRDLKPLNIMVGAFGEVQVMDWGLAKVLEHRPNSGPSSTTTPPKGPQVSVEAHSRPGLATRGGWGTYQYMPPEQARGETDDLDPRCDVFALGAILCEILTGSP